jgi:hypothetical protein
VKLEKLIGEKILPDKEKASKKLPIPDNDNISPCDFYGYSIENLMKETSELRKIIKKEEL